MDLIEIFYNDILAALGLDKMDALGRLAFYRLMLVLQAYPEAGGESYCRAHPCVVGRSPF